MASLGADGSTTLTVNPDQRRDLAPMPPEGGYGNYGNANAGGRELSLSLLWRIAYEWRWLILAAIGTGIAAAVLITLLTPLKFRSVATIELNPPQVEIMTGQDGKGARQSASGNDANFVGTQLGLLSSRALAERVAQDLNLASDPTIAAKHPEADRASATEAAAGYVQSGTDVRLQPQSMIVTVSFVSGDSALAARVVNGVVDAYIATDIERRYQSSSYARNFLQRQIATTRRDLEKSERQLTAYAQQQRLISTGSSDENGDHQFAHRQFARSAQQRTGADAGATDRGGAALSRGDAGGRDDRGKHQHRDAARPDRDAGSRISAKAIDLPPRLP